MIARSWFKEYARRTNAQAPNMKTFLLWALNRRFDCHLFLVSALLVGPLARGQTPPKDDAKFVADLNPIVKVRPGQWFQKIWRLQNTGDTTWTPGEGGYTLNEISGSRKFALLPTPVIPNEQVYISILLQAPPSGRYETKWQMNNANKASFGEVIHCIVQVESSSSPSIVAAMDKDLLNKIADAVSAINESFFTKYKLNRHQLMAWIATISWSESGPGGYGAHSRLDNIDRFNHEVVGGGFYFSTGIGPFQLDRGQPDEYDKWPTIKKLNPFDAVESVVRWHTNQIPRRAVDPCLFPTCFPSIVGGVWHGVNPPNHSNHWKAVTGETFPEVPDWGAVSAALEANADQSFKYDHNVEYRGKRCWNISKDRFDKDLMTLNGKRVSFSGEYDTWYIKSRVAGGLSSGTVAFNYYYATNSDGIEVWLYDNYADERDKRLKYIFFRDYTKTSDAQKPENSGVVLSEPALCAGGIPLDLVFCIDSTGSMADDIDEVKAAARTIVNSVFSLFRNVRMAVVDYRDFPVSPYGDPGDSPFRVRTAFTGDAQTIIQAIESISVGGGGDWPEAVYSALASSIEARELGGWRSWALRTILLMGDAPPHDPEPFTGYRKSDMIRKAFWGGTLYLGPFLPVKKIVDPATSEPTRSSGDAYRSGAAPEAETDLLSGPISIYAIVVGDDRTAASAFADLADGTDGALFPASGAEEVVDRILDVFSVIAGGGINVLDVTSQLGVGFDSWSLDWASGALVATITITNLSGKDGRPLEKVFWYALAETANVRLATVSGYTNGMAYYDVTSQVQSQLPMIGNGDLNLDVGEAVTFAVPIYSRDRSIPSGHVYSVWADPTPFASALAPRLSATPAANGELILAWPVSSVEFLIEEADGILEPNWKVLSVAPSLQEQQNTVRVPIGSGTKFYRLRRK